MSSKAPATPRKSTRTGKVTQTPKSGNKKTILTNDFEQSYVEEEDETYVYNGTSEEEEVDEEELEADAGTLSGDDNSTEVESEITNEKDPKEVECNDAKQQCPEQKFRLEPVSEISGLRRFVIKHEIVRKGLHSSFGFITLYLYSLGITHKQLVLPLTGMFVVIFTNDYIRFQNPELNKKIVTQFYYLIREREIDHYNGTLYYLAGLVLVFSVLPKDISMMSVLLLSWADTAASTFGRQFGKYTFQIAKGKSFAGALASFVTGIVGCFVLYGVFIPKYTSQVDEVNDIYWNPASSQLSFPVYAFICGLVASFSECVSIYGIDDNFTIPVISGYLLYGVTRFFHA